MLIGVSDQGAVSQCIHHEFEMQVMRTPDALAVADRSVSLSYAQLDVQANQLAHLLQEHGAGPERYVAICIERSVAFVVAVLATLKAGAAYLPLDAALPPARLRFLLHDSRPVVLLTQQALLARIDSAVPAIICLDRDAATIRAAPVTPPACAVSSEHLAYVMYTSGSTGQPKGVMVTHRAIHRLVCNTNYIQIRPDDTIAQVANSAFDAATFEIWGALLNGARLVIIPKDLMLTAEEFAEQIQRYGVTTMFLTTALFNQLSRVTPWAFKRMRHLLFGGEAADPRRVRDVLLNQPPQRLLNVYGPTETTTFAAWHLIEHVPDNAAGIPIGKPIGNDRLYVLDHNLCPMPIGVTGELYIGGAGLARGYLKRPDLTAERFVPNPFIATSSGTDAPVAQRLYKTGDLARMLPDGNIEWCGRIDYQIKLRGFRIELGEIEATLSQHPDVSEAVVVVREDRPGDRQLVAYIVENKDAGSHAQRAPVMAPGTKNKEHGNTGTQEHGSQAEPGNQSFEGLDANDPRSYLSKRLPEYMVPSAFVFLDGLPLTPNGKVDRRALPVPNLGGIDEEAPAQPRTPAEIAVARIWMEVLGRSSIGVHSHFFALGGHSLLAGQVLVRLREAFQCNLSIQLLFEQPTLAGLAAAIGAQLGGNAVADAFARSYLERSRFGGEADHGGETALPQRPRSGQIPLSFAQQRLWMVERLDPGNRSYLVPHVLRLAGPLHVAGLEQSFHEIVRRHEALRTFFRLIEDQPVQIVAAEWRLPLPLVDLEPLDAAQQTLRVQQLAALEAQQPFDLQHGPLLRMTLLRLSNQEHILLLTMHHIVVDDWSLSIFWRELAACYQALASGRSPRLHELTVQYPDASLWQHAWLQGPILAEQRAYWVEQLADCAAMLHLPTDRPRPAKQTFNGARETMILPPALSSAVNDLSQREGATPFMTLLATFQVLLQRYSGQHDFVVGTPIANRRRREFEAVIGFFVNTLPLRADLSGNPSFRELLQRVRVTALEAYAHQDLPFDQIVELVQPERDPSRNPLFQVMLALQNAPRTAIQLEGVAVELLPQTSVAAQFDLFLEMLPVDAGLLTSFEYNTDLFDVATIARMLRHFQTLLENVLSMPDLPISRLPLLTATEQHQIVVGWNATQSAYPQDRRLHELVEAQAARTPRAAAVVFEDQTLTYGELDRRANQLAHYLQHLGVGPDVIVGILVERSIEMVVGVLAVLKAGGAYLPLDPAYPQARLRWMLQDTQAPIVLTQQHLRAESNQALPGHTAHVVCLDSDWERIACEPTRPPANAATADHLAYVIYTSGSTGRPKGVAMQQRPLINLLVWQLSRWTPGSHTTLQFASLSFDVSFQEIFSTWCSGGTLVLLTAETRQDGVQLLHLLEHAGVERIFLPFVALQLLAETATQQDRLPSRLRELITAGEQLQITPTITRLLERLGRCTLHNHYGPSETHVVAAHDLAGPPSAWPALPPIGRPINNTQIYLLDQHLCPVPVGVPGELYIGGDAPARGYLNRPALTAERFIPDPFAGCPQGEAGARLYRTGDLARYLPNGDIAFLGRSDQQVKVRGYRIEPGEIESALMQHPGVREAVVIVREDLPGDKRVVGYVVENKGAREQGEQRTENKEERTTEQKNNGTTEHTDTGTALSSSELRVFLSERLPEYMVPSAIVVLDELPLTPSGKVDRRALPAPRRIEQKQRSVVAPRTPLETQIAALWAEMFGLKQIGVNEDFFTLGGHSLLAIRLTSRIKASFGVDVPLRDLFSSPTVAGCAEAIQAVQRLSLGVSETFQPPIDLLSDTLLHRSIQPATDDDWFTAEPQALFLTGVTGFLGAFLLHELLLLTNARIYCLVRAPAQAEGKRRIRETLEQYGIWDEALSARIVPVVGDLAQPRLGLDEDAFAALAARIDGIYHSGAMVSFIYSYSALRAANVLGTQEVIRLACLVKRKPLHYISTIAVAVTATASADGRIHEGTVLGPIAGMDSGYVQTKWVAEHLLLAAKERGLPVSIYRPGRIAGHSVTGASNPDDFICRLLTGWIQLGSAPAINMKENLMPVDYVARSIVYLSLQRATIGQIFHLLNPQSIDFTDLVQSVREAGFALKILPYAEWYAALLAAAQSEHDNVLYPLLSFLTALPTEAAWITFLALPPFDCHNTSAGLANSSIMCPAWSVDQIRAVVLYLLKRGIPPILERNTLPQ